MNVGVVSFFKNLFYTVSSNLISLCISSLVVLIIPKIIGVREYGYWQLYLFYTSYIGFLHFGWNDGIYLRYGGKRYNTLDKNVIQSQFFMLFLLQVIIGFTILALSYFIVSDNQKVFVIKATVACLIIVNLRYMILYILQATNRISDYARITIIDRIVYFAIITMLLFSPFKNYKPLLIADLIGKGISLCYSIYVCRDFVFASLTNFYFDFFEAWQNISAGIKLMLSNIAGKFILGFVKLGIENTWSIETFGKVSLTLSVSNLVMIFINAVSMIMYPILRKVEKNKLPDIYCMMRDVLMAFLFLILIFYYPLKIILVIWLPEYADSLQYMGLLFPIIIFEGKVSLLVNTFLKTMREEKNILIINVLTVIISAIVTVITTLVLKNLVLAMTSIVFLYALRCAIAELILQKLLQINLCGDIILELILTIGFIFIAYKINSIFMMFWYGWLYFFYLSIKRNYIKQSYQKLKTIMYS